MDVSSKVSLNIPFSKRRDEKDVLLLSILIVFPILSIIFISVFESEYSSLRLNTALREITVRVSGLKSAYHWIKKLMTQGYVVEIHFINEPGYPYEVYRMKYGFSSCPDVPLCPRIL
ncbi:MAG: hypothetical protein ACUVQY_01635 [Thermoproteota archaeon]